MIKSIEANRLRRCGDEHEVVSCGEDSVRLYCLGDNDDVEVEAEDEDEM
jgi:hypothetical protein